MIDSIRRTDNTVHLEVDTGLVIKEPSIFFSYEAETEMVAALLRKYLYDLKFEAKKRIARDCLMYLSREEKSALKSKLKYWNGAKHCWK